MLTIIMILTVIIILAVQRMINILNKVINNSNHAHFDDNSNDVKRNTGWCEHFVSFSEAHKLPKYTTLQNQCRTTYNPTRTSIHHHMQISFFLSICVHHTKVFFSFICTANSGNAKSNQACKMWQISHKVGGKANLFFLITHDLD